MSANDDARQAEFDANVAKLDKLLRGTSGEEHDALDKLRKAADTLAATGSRRGNQAALRQAESYLDMLLHGKSDTLATPVPAYLNPDHPRYAPKLAAAVAAWQAVGEPEGMTPVQAMTKWLEARVDDFGLRNKNGKPNRTGIEECAKVANWKPEGGSANTPG